jgi:hypothetical protein
MEFSGDKRVYLLVYFTFHPLDALSAARLIRIGKSDENGWAG